MLEFCELVSYNCSFNILVYQIIACLLIIFIIFFILAEMNKCLELEWTYWQEQSLQSWGGMNEIIVISQDY